MVGFYLFTSCRSKEEGTELLLSHILTSAKKYVRKLKQNKIKVRLSLSKKWFICFNQSPLKMMKNAFFFYLILKFPFVIKILKILFRLFGRVEKRPG